jgi:hypothetical protein
MVEDLPLYQYQALPLLMDQIRLLILDLGSNDDPIRCSLKNVPLDEAECQYEGISYVWGKSDDITNIECDGKKFPIRANLHDALQIFCMLRINVSSRLMRYALTRRPH